MTIIYTRSHYNIKHHTTQYLIESWQYSHHLSCTGVNYYVATNSIKHINALCLPTMQTLTLQVGNIIYPASKHQYTLNNDDIIRIFDTRYEIWTVCQQKIKSVLPLIIHEHIHITLDTIRFEVAQINVTSPGICNMSVLCIHSTCSVTTTKIYSIISAVLINSVQMVLPYLSSHGLAVKE